MNRKVKTLLKIAVPFAIIGQLAAVIAILSTHKAFSCKAVREYLVCRQVELP
ncbi:MAG: hypothetical protein CM15mL4_0450 [uncultured marine virus]|nr:MAG: hypothetical protein CM15mL4_0450 [uncultured marine virus]